MIPDALSQSLTTFETISLQQLNSSAQLMQRSEVKYIVHSSQLLAAIQRLEDNYSMLEINNNNIFSYQNVYMDTDDHMCYQIHASGQKSRFKVRTRHYVDADLYFCEFKHKYGKQLSKFRYQCQEEDHGVFSPESKQFCDGVYQGVFGETLPTGMSPSLQNGYKRVTLCSKKYDEKMTIDFGFTFKDLKSGKSAKLKDIVIIESKAIHQPANSAPLFESLGILPAGPCSKYCLGLILTGNASDTHHFDPTLAHIKSLQENYKTVGTKETIRQLSK